MFGETSHRYPVLDLQAEHPSLWAQVSHGEVCPFTLSLAVIIACHFSTVVSLPFSAKMTALLSTAPACSTCTSWGPFAKTRNR
jgi:hypothetical protein